MGLWTLLNFTTTENLEALDNRLVLVWDTSKMCIHDHAIGTRTQDLQSHARTLSF